MQKIIKSKSDINYNYATIKITKSRIDKGLIAIPVSLAKWFPANNEDVQIHLGDSPISETKHYSSYNSSTRECRIGGMKQWFQHNDIKSGDELVIQLIDKKNFIYRLIPERNFIIKARELEGRFDNSETHEDASEKILDIARWTHLDKSIVIFNEYSRLINTMPFKERAYIRKKSDRAKESVSPNVRTLLENIYNGHCQVCDFWFLKRDGNPYFEIHHLNPMKDHHPKNLVVVCGNCHNQFEFSNVRQEFNEHNWLITVSFNIKIYPVKQAILTTPTEEFFKETYI